MQNIFPITSRFKTKIPKIIHQTWKSREIPGEYQKWVESWIKYNPGWEYKLWTDDDNRNLIKNHFPEHLQMYDSFPKNIMRVDTIRYFILYKYGGVYADLDFECISPLISLLANHSAVIGQEPIEHARVHGKNRMVCNAWMASEPGHPFWHAIISEIHKRHAEGVDNVMGMTGPVLVDDVYEHYSKSGINPVYLAPVEALYPLLAKMHGGKFRKSGQVYAIHHWKNSWTKSPSIPPNFPEFTFYPTLDSPLNDVEKGNDLEETRRKCLLNKDTICFNTDGWTKKHANDLQRVWPSDRGIYIKKFPNSFPIFEDYDLYVGKDSYGYDLYRFVSLDMNLLKKIADNDPSIVAFNSDGCMKYKLDKIEIPNNGLRGNTIAIYIKKNSKIPTWMENWDYYPCVDSIGNDIDKLNKQIIKPFSNLLENGSYSFMNEKNINEIIFDLEKNPDVKAFNTQGFVKSNIRPNNEWQFYPVYRYMGLFVKKENIKKRNFILESDNKNIEEKEIIIENENEIIIKKEKDENEILIKNEKEENEIIIKNEENEIIIKNEKEENEENEENEILKKKENIIDTLFNKSKEKNLENEIIQPFSKEELKDAKIPKIIWQTYKSSSQLPMEALQCISSWKKNNPEYEYRFMDDSQMLQFVEKEFSEPYISMFHSMPIPVMKADVWRIMVLYIYGGIYTDIDTKCLISIKNWENINNHSFIIGYESDDLHFCNWTMASSPRHPILKSILDQMVERSKDGINKHYKHFVHYHSGPGVVTKGISKFFEIGDSFHGKLRSFKVPKDYSTIVSFYPDNYFSSKYVNHLEASLNWKNKNYNSWKSEMESLNQNSRNGFFMKDIEKLYLDILRRPIDIEGKNHYQKQMIEQNWTIEQIKFDILNSQEFKEIQKKETEQFIKDNISKKSDFFITLFKKYNLEKEDIINMIENFKK